MTRAETVRSLVGRLHAAGGADFREENEGSGVHSWKARLGRWPFEMQVDRFALELRCYLAEELFCTGRLPEHEAETLVRPVQGRGGDDALRRLGEFVDAEVRDDSRRFMTPPHAERHSDRRSDDRERAAIEEKPPRRIDLPG